MSKLSSFTTKSALAAIAAVATLAATTGAADAQQFRRNHLVQCESVNNGYNRCYIRTRGQVQLVRQLSSRSCSHNRDWGYDKNQIWVANGCRAVFSVPRGRRFVNNNGNNGTWGNNGNNGQWGNNGNNGTWGNNGNNGNWNNGPVYDDSRRRWRDGRRAGNRFQRYVDCQSFSNRYQFCRINVRSSVQLYQQLSSDGCAQGRTWGFRQDGIWVKNGCRATFLVQ